MAACNSKRARQFESHGDLVRFADSLPVTNGDGIDLDAVVVPSARRAFDYLHDAARLAGELDCWILVLCSRDAQADEAIEVFETHHLTRAVAIEIRDDYQHEMFEFVTSGPQVTGQAVHEKSDLSLKRNIGLVISRLLSWRAVLFLDDDIRNLDAISVRRAVRLLATFDRVGFRVIEHPDNSVMCHAHRDLFGEQDVFAGGSALAVNCRSELPFFPHIYNEDWLFLYSSLLRGEVCVAGDVQQLWFDPYADPRRAASEELGDVIGEGLLGGLHLPRPNGLPSREYWADFLHARDQFLTEIMQRAKAVNFGRIYQAAEAAHEVLDSLTSEQCHEFISLWQDDLERWGRRLRRLECLDSLESALKELSLPAAFPAPANARLVRPYQRSTRQKVIIRLLDDPSALRDLRLRALKTSPDAFAADFNVEVVREKEDEGYWRRMLRSATWFAASIDEVHVGMAAVIQEPNRPSWERHVQSMWVDPEYRGAGIGRQLIHAVAHRTAEEGACLLSLWVFVLNITARDFYIRLGFRSMEQVQSSKGDPLKRKEERFGARVA